MRADSRINSIINAAESTDLEKYYILVKKYARKEGLFLSKMLEQVFYEFCKSHKLFEGEKKNGTDTKN